MGGRKWSFVCLERGSRANYFAKEFLNPYYISIYICFKGRNPHIYVQNNVHWYSTTPYLLLTVLEVVYMDLKLKRLQDWTCRPLKHPSSNMKKIREQSVQPFSMNIPFSLIGFMFINTSKNESLCIFFSISHYLTFIILLGYWDTFKMPSWN